MPIIAVIPDEERQLMRKEIQQTRDKNYARRLIAMLMLHRGMTVTDVARLLCAARSSVGRWINWFTLHGIEGLQSLRSGRAPRWPVADILQVLPLLVQRSPQDFGWLRSRWSTELCITTPGHNQKHYLAGALHSDTRRVHYVGGNSKCSDLFINLLEALRRTYRRAKTLTIVVDNYIIHKSHKVERWLEKNKKFRLLFLPTYSPWLNPIELLWLSLHETITRNHQCRYMWQLLGRVNQFMNAASPFPGNHHGLAKVER
ncbi:IS630 family transposase [Pectobacterium atrosepticum]|nr:IS630 family transposase [Pectobacterium atrosepticum]